MWLAQEGSQCIQMICAMHNLSLWDNLSDPPHQYFKQLAKKQLLVMALKELTHQTNSALLEDPVSAWLPHLARQYEITVRPKPLQGLRTAK